MIIILVTNIPKFIIYKGCDREGRGWRQGNQSQSVGDLVLDSKVIYHQGKDDVTRDATEETGGGGLVEAVRSKMGEETGLRELACLL